MSILEVNNICKRFQDNEVLKGISFSLEEGQVLSIIGSSGSGKTTLLRCITGLETADSGSICVGGRMTFDSERREKLSKAEKRENQLCTGLVFQSFNLFPQYTVLRNVTLAKELLVKETCRAEKCDKKEKKARLAAIEDEAKRVIESVGLSDKLASYPCELSGGQQQRVAIARALMLSPKVLCFDEDRIVMRTVKGELTVAGEGLHIGKLSLDTGELSVEGKVSELSYEEAAPAGGFWSRLFG